MKAKLLKRDFNEELENIAEKIVFTGPIDKFYNY